MKTQLVNVAQINFEPQKINMPLTLRNCRLNALRQPNAKSTHKKTASPHPSPSHLEPHRIQSRLTDRQFLLSPSTRSSSSKRKTLLSALSPHGLFKQAKKIDLNDPTQTFLPPKQGKKCPLMPKQARRDGRKYSGDNYPGDKVLQARDHLNQNNQKQNQQTFSYLDTLSFGEVEIIQVKKGLESSLTQLILFGNEDSIEIKELALEDKISRDYEMECKKLLRELSGSQTNDSSEPTP